MATSAEPRIIYDILARVGGSVDVNRLADALERVDESIDPEAAKRAKELADQLRLIGQQQAAISQFVELKNRVQEASNSLDGAQAAAQKLAKELADVEKPTRSQEGQMAKLAATVRAAKAELTQQSVALDKSRGDLAALGVSTSGLVRAQQDLKSSLATTVQSVRDFSTAQAEAAAAAQRAREAEAQAAEASKISAIAAKEAATSARVRAEAIDAVNAKVAESADKTKQALTEAATAVAKFDVQVQSLKQAGGVIDPAVVERANALTAALRTLGQQNAAVDRFIELKRQTEAAKVALDQAQTAAQEYHRQIAAVGVPTDAQAIKMAQLAGNVRIAKENQLLYTQALMDARSGLGSMGIAVDGLAKTQQELRTSLASTVQTVREFNQAQTDAVAAAQLNKQAAAAAADAAKIAAAADRERAAAIEAVNVKVVESANKTKAAIAETTVAVAKFDTQIQSLKQLGTSIDPSIVERANALTAALRQLGQQNAAIDRFAELKSQSEAAKVALAGAQAAAQEFHREIAAAGAPTGDQAVRMAQLAGDVKIAEQNQLLYTQALIEARAHLTVMGVAITGAAQKQAEFRRAVKDTNDEIAAMSAQNKLVSEFSQIAAATDKARAAVVAAETAYEKFRKGLEGVIEPTAMETRQLNALSESTRKAQVQFLELVLAEGNAAAGLEALGVDTDRFAVTQSRARAALVESALAADRLTASHNRQGTAARVAGQAEADAAKLAAAGITSVADSFNSLKNIGIAGFIGSETAQLLKGVVQTADAYSDLSARIKIAIGANGNFAEAMSGVHDIAIRSSSALNTTADLFGKIAIAGRELGVSQKEALALTETINQAVQLSGSSAESSNAAIIQLIQGLQSGVLRGEEFNSVMEQAPRLAIALADGLGVTTGQLRKLANEGTLTTSTVIEALKKQSDAIKKEFDSLPPTVARAITNLQTEWSKLVGTFNNESGSTAAISAGINKLAEHLDSVARLAAIAGTALVAELAVKGVSALRRLSAELLITTGSANILTASLSRIPAVINITIAAIGFEVGYQIGQMLHENSELARKLGIGVVEYFQKLIAAMQGIYDAAAAVFTSDTIDAAYKRMIERIERVRSITKDMYAEAGKGPKQVAREAEEASKSVEKMGDSAGPAADQINKATQQGAASLDAMGGSAKGAAGSVGAIGAAGHGAAAGVSSIGAAGTTASAALVELADTARVSLPGVGATIQQQAGAFVDFAIKSQRVQDILSRDLPASLAKLSGVELVKFRAAFAGAIEASITQSQRAAEIIQSVGENSDKALADATAKGRLLQRVLVDVGTQAASALGVDLAGLGIKVSKEFAVAEQNLSTLIRSMPALKAAGVDAGTAVAESLSNMIDAARSQAELDVITQRVKVLTAELQITGQQGDGAFKRIAERAVEIKDAIEEATPGIQSLREAVIRVGGDFDQMTTGVSLGFKKSMDDVKGLVFEVIRAGVEAEKASPVLEAAFDKQIAAAKTKEELKLVNDQILKAIDNSKIFGPVGEAELRKIQIAAERLSPAFKQAADDAALLGVTLQTTAEKSSESFIKAYERQKESGKVTAKELQQEFITLAERVIKSTDGIVPAWLQVEAQMRGVVIQIDEFGIGMAKAAAAGQQAGTVIDKSFKQIAGSISAATKELDVFSAAGIKANNAANLSVLGTNKYSDPKNNRGDALTDSGQLLQVGGKSITVPDGYSFDQNAFIRAQNMAQRTGGVVPDPSKFYKAPSGNSGVSKAAQDRIDAQTKWLNEYEANQKNLLESLIAGGGFESPYIPPKEEEEEDKKSTTKPTTTTKPGTTTTATTKPGTATPAPAPAATTKPVATATTPTVAPSGVSRTVELKLTIGNTSKSLFGTGTEVDGFLQLLQSAARSSSSPS